MHKKVSVIIPVLSEFVRLKSLLPYLCNELLTQEKEIIVAVSANDPIDYSTLITGATIKLHKCIGAGRAVQMNEGAAIADGDFYFFVHADVLPPRSALQMIRNRAEAGMEAGFFSYSFDVKSRLLSINAKATKKDGWHAGGGDQCHWMTKEVFESLNGYNAEMCIMEDFDMVKRWRKFGVKYTIIKENARFIALIRT